MMGLFRAEPGGRSWRRILSEEARLDHAGPEIIKKAAEAALQVQAAATRRRVA